MYDERVKLRLNPSPALYLSGLFKLLHHIRIADFTLLSNILGESKVRPSEHFRRYISQFVIGVMHE